MRLSDGLSWGRIATITGLLSSSIWGSLPRCGGRGFPRSPDNPSTRRKLCKNAGTLDSEGTRAVFRTRTTAVGAFGTTLASAHVAGNLILGRQRNPKRSLCGGNNRARKNVPECAL